MTTLEPGEMLPDGSPATPSDSEMPGGQDPSDTGGVRSESSTAGAGARRGRPPTRGKGPTLSLGSLRQQLADAYTLIGVAVSPVFALPGLVIVKQADACADAWIAAAEVNPTIRKNLERLMTVTVYGAILAAHYPIVVAFGVQAGSIPLDSPVTQPIRQEIGIVMEQYAKAQAAAQAQADNAQPAPQ